jgi:hypothetical protein
MMRTPKKISRAEMIRRHQSPNYDAVGDAAEAPNRGAIPRPAPVSIRLSQPLLDALDLLAAQQHRNRSNLIQHILWEFVRARDKRK